MNKIKNLLANVDNAAHTGTDKRHLETLHRFLLEGNYAAVVRHVDTAERIKIHTSGYMNALRALRELFSPALEVETEHRMRRK